MVAGSLLFASTSTTNWRRFRFLIFTFFLVRAQNCVFQSPMAQGKRRILGACAPSTTVAQDCGMCERRNGGASRCHATLPAGLPDGNDPRQEPPLIGPCTLSRMFLCGGRLVLVTVSTIAGWTRNYKNQLQEPTRP